MAKQMITAHLEGEAMTAQSLAEVDIFKDLKAGTLEKFPGTVSRRVFKKGQTICRQGEGGTTAFYVLEGSVQIFIERSQAGVRKTKRQQLANFVSKLFGQQIASTSRSHEADKMVPIDATVDLTYGRLTTSLGPGELFGEMSCLNLAPRSATVVAETDCVLIEMLRNIYEQLQKSKTFKERMDANYRSRALSGHLRNVPIFEGLEEEDINRLRDRAELLTIPAGMPVFKQDDPSDGLYIIRLGQIKVSQRMPGGERTLAYLTRGDCFGETGLLRSTTRNATCSAVDHPIIDGNTRRKPAQAEVVRINPEEFAFLIEKYPRVRKALEKLASKREAASSEAAVSVGSIAVSPRAESLGLLQGQNLMLIDLEKCTRCDQCVDACVAAHDDGLPRLVRDGPRFEKFLVASTCRMCRDPACMIGCPVGSIRRTESLNIFIEDWCIGCGVCAKQCPYDSIQLHEIAQVATPGTPAVGADGQAASEGDAAGDDIVSVTERAVVCDQCNSLSTGPACVYACPHDAATRVNAATFLGMRRASVDLTEDTVATSTATTTETNR